MEVIVLLLLPSLQCYKEALEGNLCSRGVDPIVQLFFDVYNGDLLAIAPLWVK